MAAAIKANDPRKSDTVFVGKFVLEVILYNMQTCGYERQFAFLNYPNIGYCNPNIVRIAAVSVLRLCLTYREKWKENIKKLAKNVSVYDSTFFTDCFCHIVELAQNEGKEALQLNVEITLALSTEMALFLTTKNKLFDFLGLVSAATTNIVNLIETPMERTFKLMYCPTAPPVNFKQELEKLFSEFDNIWELLSWIEGFITRFASPYGSKGDVSLIFYREVGKRWKDIVQRVFRGEKPTDEAVIINLGFLPREAYDNIAAEMSVPMPKYSEIAWGRKPSKSSSSSIGEKSSGKQPTASGSASRQTAQAGTSSKDSSKQTKKGSTKRASRGRKNSSKQGGGSGKDSSKQGAQSGEAIKDSSKQGAEGIEDSLDPGLTESVSRMDLSSEGNSQAKKGAIPKTKDSKK